MVDEGVGFVVIGASKRGQLTWMVSVADRPDLFPPILATLPSVPIFPSMVKDMHRMWQSYGGFTFAMRDFINIGLIDDMDSQKFQDGLAKVDPFSF